MMAQQYTSALKVSNVTH